MAYDPIPDLAALIAGLHQLDLSPVHYLADLLAGPYARLRSGLGLDEPGREDTPRTETALRKALRELQP